MPQPGYPQPGYPQPGAMPSMPMQMPSMPTMPAFPGMVGPQQPMFPMPQPGPMPMQPMMPQSPAPAAPMEAPAPATEEPKAEEPAAKASEEPQPAASGHGIDLNFDPNEKEALPFDMPGSESSETNEFELPPMPDNLAPAAPANLPHPMDFASEADAGPRPPVIRVLCPRGHRLQMPAARAGKRSRCPICGEEFLLPNPGGPARSVAKRKAEAAEPSEEGEAAKPAEGKPKRKPLDPKTKQTRIAWGLLIGLIVFVALLVAVFAIWSK
jgi:hypothetical protein